MCSGPVQPQDSQQGVRALASLFPAKTVNGPAQFQMLLHGERIEQAQVFRKNAGQSLDSQRLLHDVHARDVYLTSIRSQQARQHFQQRRFARAVRPHGRANAVRNLEVDVVNRQEIPKVLRDMLALDRVHNVLTYPPRTVMPTSASVSPMMITTEVHATAL